MLNNFIQRKLKQFPSQEIYQATAYAVRDLIMDD